MFFVSAALPSLVRADMDVGTLSALIRQKKLGLTDEETQQALDALGRDQVQVDLNLVGTAKDAASPELMQISDSLANPFDGSAGLSGGSFAGYVPPVPGTVVIDKRTGKPKKQPPPRRQASLSSDGQCAAAAEAAIRDFKEIVSAKIQENDDEELVAAGLFGEFFKMIGELFFPRGSEKKFPMPTVTSGKTVTETAIATYHPGSAGLITFDCEKFTGYGSSMRRKIACHEFYHWYQDRINALEEPSAYAVMPHC